MLLAVLTVFNSCQKDELVVQTNNEIVTLTSLNLTDFQRDDVIENLAKVLALAINEKSVRKLLHEEIAKQFTNDYDILYSLIKDKMIELESNEMVSFEIFLAKTALENKIDISLFFDLAPSFKNLQISSPVYFEDWSYESFKPVVISLPVNYNTENKVAVKGYFADGSVKDVLENKITEPIILVRRAERVDDDGLMRVDFNGFVIPEEDRSITAKDAYMEVSMPGYLKSASLARSIIEVIDYNEMENVKSIYRSGNHFTRNNGLDIKTVAAMFNELDNNNNNNNNNTLLKSAQSSLPIPKVKSVFPDEPYAIRFGWEGVAGATQYEIWRQFSSYPVEKIATLSADDFTYMDINRTSGQSFYYAIRALDNIGNTSPMSEPYEAIASWRKNGSRDVIERVFISKDCWNWCCGLFDGKIELQYKLAYYDHIIKIAAAYPSGSINLNNLG